MIYMSKGGHIRLVEESAVPKWKALGFTAIAPPESAAEKRKKANGKNGE